MTVVVHETLKKSDYEFLRDRLVENLKVMPTSQALNDVNQIANALAHHAALHMPKKKANVRIGALVKACETLALQMRTALLEYFKEKQ